MNIVTSVKGEATKLKTLASKSGSFLRDLLKRLTIIRLVIGLAVILILASLYATWHIHNVHRSQQRALANDARQRQALLQNLIVQQDQQLAKLTDPVQKAAIEISKASLLSDEGKSLEALAAYKEAYRLQPSSVNVITTLAAAYMRAKDKDNSITLYNKAIALIQADPNSPYKANLKYYQDVVANLQKSDFSQPREGGSWLGS